MHGGGLLVNAVRDSVKPASETGNNAWAGLVGKRFIPFDWVFVGAGSVEGRFVRFDRIIEVVLEDAVGVRRVPFFVQDSNLFNNRLLPFRLSAWPVCAEEDTYYDH